MTKRQLSDVAVMAVLTVLYFGAGKLGLSLAFLNRSASPVWPPTGMALAAILLFGYRVWPAILLGAFLVNMSTAPDVPSSAAIAIGNTLEAVLGAVLVQRFAHGVRAFDRATDTVKFLVLAAGLSTIVSATIGVTALCLRGLAPWGSYGPIWLTWWLGDATSDLVVAPVLLILGARPAPHLRTRQWLEAAALLLAVFLVGQAIFNNWIPAHFRNEALAYAGIPLLLWAAFRFSLHGAAIVACIISAMAIRATLSEHDAVVMADPNAALMMLQAFIGSITMTALILAAVLMERTTADKALHTAMEALKEANQAKDRFLAVLSHELRTPLNPVLMVTGLLERDPRLTDELRQDIQMIHRNVTLEARLIDDLLDLTRITKDKMALRLAAVELEQILEQALQICRPELEAKSIGLSRDIQSSQHIVRGDAIRLQQVFWNLLKNAIKFTPAGGRITVRCFGENQQVVAEISDTGVGIQPDVLPHIFNAFVQGNPSTTRQFGGLGLGLAIARALVEMHGGTITAQSAGKDRGACFRVTLSAVTTAPVPAEAPELTPVVASASHVKARVLLVEDHADTARITSRALGLGGYTVRAASSVAAAIALAGQETFDVLVSDIGLPDGSGWELMAQLRRNRPGFKGIVISGYGMENDVRRSQEAGFTAHLTKPVNITDLEAAIERVLAQSAAELVAGK